MAELSKEKPLRKKMLAGGVLPASKSHIVIENIEPSIDDGRYPAKKVIGEPCLVEADIFRHGFEPILSILKWRKNGSPAIHEIPMTNDGNDTWRAEIPLVETGRYFFTIDASTDNGKETARVIPEREIMAISNRALFGAWYEFFIRSQSPEPGRSGTFRDAENRLDDIKAMGFDILYLAPIHPIGQTARKGRNDSLNAEPTDPGCPWSIGNNQGGHTAIEPSLGTLSDFQHFLNAVHAREMDVALDFAVQCSPDHPWVGEHPKWFYREADGRIKCAENPPMKYEDIVPLNFESEEWEKLWRALLDVVLFWVGQGVKIFRVDNPHTKPLAFWRWLISEVHNTHPDVLFLGEAFTRPKMMKALSKAGFTQSYTYFTWRNSKQELTAYMTELTQTSMKKYFIPNFFTSTHDVLPEILQTGGPAAFRMRFLLAATLSPTYGIYSGYELFENEGKPGTQDYLNSEKFELKTRDWNKQPHMKDFITKLNAIRRENPAFQTLTPLDFLTTDNEHILSYCKSTPNRDNLLLVVVNLDPHHAQHGTVSVPLEKMGFPSGSRFSVEDLLTGQTHQWGDQNFIRLDTQGASAHIMRVQR